MCIRDSDIVTHARDRLHQIAETIQVYDALQYSLVFCQGQDGYHFILKLRDSNTGRETNKVSALQFYSHRLVVRKMSVMI